jgi:WhiB family redox-sensing transcriptional regulator
MTRRVTDWQPEAACAEIGPGAFLLDDEADTATAIAMYNQVRPVCDRCPVKTDCLEFALAVEGGAGSSFRSGMYGGRTPKERYRIHKRREQAALDAIAAAA